MSSAIIDCVVIPFVGTLNDDDVASPVFYLNEEGKRQERLVETAAIEMRKERVLYYLRHLACRFLNGERLMLTAFFLTRNNRNVDGTNVLDLIQNAGNGVIWNDDSQFISVRCDRFVLRHLKPECERTVIYINEVRENFLEKPTYRASRYGAILKNFREQHDDIPSVRRIFGLDACFRYYNTGFWEDDRFLDVPCLVANYQQWLVQHRNRGPASR